MISRTGIDVESTGNGMRSRAFRSPPSANLDHVPVVVIDLARRLHNMRLLKPTLIIMW
jgi:(p)ppGpp synthase/HD superfamily hydrolase